MHNMDAIVSLFSLLLAMFIVNGKACSNEYSKVTGAGGSSHANAAVAMAPPSRAMHPMEYWQAVLPETPMPQAIHDLLTTQSTDWSQAEKELRTNGSHDEEDPRKTTMSYESHGEEDPRKTTVSYASQGGEGPRKTTVSYGEDNTRKTTVSYGSPAYGSPAEKDSRKIDMTYGSHDEEDPRKTSVSYELQSEEDPRKTTVSYAFQDGEGPRKTTVSYGSQGEDNTRRTTVSYGSQAEKDSRNIDATYGSHDDENPRKTTVSYELQGEEDPGKTTVSYGSQGEGGPRKTTMSYGSQGEDNTRKTTVSYGLEAEKWSRKIKIAYGSHEEGDPRKTTVSYELQGEEKPRKTTVSYGSQGEEDSRKTTVSYSFKANMPDHDHSNNDGKESLADVFFFPDVLRPGSVITPTIPPTTSLPSLLPRHIAETIPFSTERYTDILEIFAPASSSPAMAGEIRWTLDTCEHPRLLPGEKVGCATSLEALGEIPATLLGTHNVRAFSANMPVDPAGMPARRGSYTMTAVRKLSESLEAVTCHDLVYPYAVFYCHTTHPAATYVVTLATEEDEGGAPAMEVLAVCHLDTSRWSPENQFFVAHNLKPGDVAVCHFLSKLSIIWVPVGELGDARDAK
ncbi:hypothetical protein ACP70R_047253 [Stipagrostis hirtigluma subsp. patula]